MSPRDAVDRWNREEDALGVPDLSRSFLIEGESAGPRVLLIHGGGGDPDDFRHLGARLAELGYTTLCPRLPAHGLGERELGDLRFDDLVGRVLEAWDALGPGTAVVALSLGAVLGVRLVTERPAPGFVALAPAFRPRVGLRAFRLVPMFLRDPELARLTYRWQMEARRGIEGTLGRIPDVTCPLLVLYSDDDDSVRREGAALLFREASSTEKSLEILSGQGHVLTRAPDREREVYSRIETFLKTITAAATRT